MTDKIEREALVSQLHRGRIDRNGVRRAPDKVKREAAKALTEAQADIARLREELSLWRMLVNEGGVPRYTVTPGAALNTVVTSTDSLLRQAALKDTQGHTMTDKIEVTVDSGMDAATVATAEALWTSLPVFPRKWGSLHTREKALICHTVIRFEHEARLAGERAGMLRAAEIAEDVEFYSADDIAQAIRAQAGEAS